MHAVLQAHTGPALRVRAAAKSKACINKGPGLYFIEPAGLRAPTSLCLRGLPGLVSAPATEGEEQRRYASGAGAGGARRTHRLQRHSWRGRGAPLLLQHLHLSKACVRERGDADEHCPLRAALLGRPADTCKRTLALAANVLKPVVKTLLSKHVAPHAILHHCF